jgi:hypothetical protein
VSRQRRRTLVAAGVLVPLGGGVLRHAATPESWPQAALAAVLAAGDGAVASHLTAAALHRFDGIPRGEIEVTVPRERSPRGVPGRVHRSRDLVVADVDARARIPCTTPSRTLVDIAAVLPAAALEQALDGAERDGKMWRPHLRWRLDELRHQGRPGIRPLEALLDRTEGRPVGESWLEQQALRLLRRAGLPLPRCQVELRKSGAGIARVDLLWDAARLVVELDGHATHATRRRRQSDAERAARLGLEGWHVLSFTYEDVTERPAYVVEMIRRYLAR